MLEAELGRFLSRDPLGYVDGNNSYSYAGDHVLELLDPSGTQSCKVKSFDVRSNLCTMGKIGNDVRYGTYFHVTVEFKKPCCGCCEFRQYVSCAIRKRVYNPSEQKWGSWHIEETEGEVYEDCDADTGDCYGRKDHPGIWYDEYSKDGCKYQSHDFPGQGGLKEVFEKYPATIMEYQIRCQFVLNIVDVCDGGVVRTELLDFDCDKIITADDVQKIVKL